jgi:hypothetical protein
LLSILFDLFQTGLKPHYDIGELDEFTGKIINGETAFIDPRFQDRSFGDARLAEIIPLCWKHDPDERIDIFGLVELLRAAVHENDQHIEESKM